MKQLLLICAVVTLVGGCASTPTNPNWVSDPSDPINVKIEAAIRKAAKKPTGELTQADLEKVTKLNLIGNRLTKLPKGLEKLTKLKKLFLQSNNLTDVKGLEKLTQLTWLSLESNKLTNVKGLEKLTQLMSLHLDSNQLTDVKGLEKLTQLMSLDLDNNKLTSVKGLEKFTKLRHLYIYDNPALTKAQIAELQKTLPKCKIWSNPTN